MPLVNVHPKMGSTVVHIPTIRLVVDGFTARGTSEAAASCATSQVQVSVVQPFDFFRVCRQVGAPGALKKDESNMACDTVVSWRASWVFTKGEDPQQLDWCRIATVPGCQISLWLYREDNELHDRSFLGLCATLGGCWWSGREVDWSVVQPR